MLRLCSALYAYDLSADRWEKVVRVFPVSRHGTMVLTFAGDACWSTDSLEEDASPRYLPPKFTIPPWSPS